ncbi:AEC family transporter [Alkalihalobacillus pseudalcaliphilus]|uniref:AEC family transporter n=1 Tax=Alkalihalobacillus pseudalcaliphilus TaxID=79884 RepID=UPI0030811880
MIFLDVILPILILMALGLVIQKKYQFQLAPISKWLVHCFMPAAVFLNIYQVHIDFSLLAQLLMYLLIFTIAMIFITYIIGKVFSVQDHEEAALKNSISLMNSGNYGLPVSQLIFSANPLGVSIQIFVLIFQNMLTYTYGLYNLLSTTKSFLEIMKSFLKLPLIYALVLGLFFQIFDLSLPSFLLFPIEHLANGFVAVALLLLGAQLANIQIRVFHRVITLALIGRLLVGPLVAVGVIYLLQIDGVMAQSLLIASSFPTSRNTATLALEYDVAPELHAQIVLYSTLLSSLTVTFVIYLALLLF